MFLMAGENGAKKFPVEVLKSRACNAVGIAVHNRKYSITDRTQIDPIVENIRCIRDRDERKCIEKTVRVVMRTGEEKGRLKELVEAFFWKGNESDKTEMAFLENGKKIAEIILSFREMRNSERFANYLINILVDSADVKAVEAAADTFDSIRKISKEGAFVFLYRAVIVASKEPSETLKFVDLMGISPVISSLKLCAKKSEDFGMIFLKSSTNIAYFTRNEDAVREAALATLVACGNCSDEGLYSFLNGIALVANVTKSGESIKHAVETAYKFSNNGDEEEMKEFFGYIEKLVKETEDPAEAVIGVVSYCRQTADGKDMRRYIDPSNVQEPEIQPEEEDEFPEFMEDERGGLTALEKLEAEFRDSMGDRFAEVFLERIELVEPEEQGEMCMQYGKILNAINSTCSELEDGPRAEYVWMAGEMFKNMDNGFLFAPLAYRVLGEIVRTDAEKAENFVWQAIEAESSEKLADICRNST